MEIILENISKRYGSQWVFKNLNFTFKSGHNYALVGSNGTGKSTLINILVGKIPNTKGKVTYRTKEGVISIDDVFKEFSISTTSMSVIEEFTLEELLKFHFRFRKPVENLDTSEIVKLLGLHSERKKFISNFSSGMKQRLKIGLALFSHSSVLIFDEPGANLDLKSKEWFQNLLSEYKQDRTLIIASNEAEDYKICDRFLDVTDFK